jgi:CRP/FNR family transcriptional regulator
MNLDALLRAHRDFKDFSAEERGELLGLFTEHTHADGAVLICEGDAGDAMYLIVDGQLLVTRRDTGGEPLRICVMGAGELVGLVALIDPGPRTATCTVVGGAKVARLSAADFERLFAADAPLAYRLQYLIARQLASDLRLYNDALADTLTAPNDPQRFYDIIGTASIEYRVPRGFGA